LGKVKPSWKRRAQTTKEQTTISIQEGLFATRTGETITPALDSAEISVVAEGGGRSSGVQVLSATPMLGERGEATGENTQASDDNLFSPFVSLVRTTLGILAGLAVATGGGLIGRRYWQTRGPKGGQQPAAIVMESVDKP
jgi:hypothetical protein